VGSLCSKKKCGVSFAIFLKGAKIATFANLGGE